VQTLVKDMALRNEDREWISAQIAEAIAAVKPRGWRKFVHLVRDWGVMGAIITAFVGTIGVVIAVIVFATNGITKNAEFRTNTTDRLANIEKDVGSIKASLANLQIIQGAQHASDPNSAKAIASVVRTATIDKVPIDPQLVNSAGKTFVDASRENSDAWQTALALLTYRSFLNAPLIPPGKQYSFSTHYDAPGMVKLGTVRSIGSAIAPDVSEWRLLSAPNLNEKLATGPQYLLADGFVLNLDNTYARKVIFINSRIIYNGGPIKLDDVYFINCTFEMSAKPNVQNLAVAIFSPKAATTFAAG
jgi:hypothetical protein